MTGRPFQGVEIERFWRQRRPEKTVLRINSQPRSEKRHYQINARHRVTGPSSMLRLHARRFFDVASRSAIFDHGRTTLLAFLSCNNSPIQSFFASRTLDPIQNVISGEFSGKLLSIKRDSRRSSSWTREARPSFS